MSPIFKKQTTNGNIYTLSDPYSNLSAPKEEEAASQCRCPEFWLASKVVTDPERRFISDSKINILGLDLINSDNANEAKVKIRDGKIAQLDGVISQQMKKEAWSKNRLE